MTKGPENPVAVPMPNDDQLVPASITPMTLLQSAIDKGTDLDQLQKLMDLADRHEANGARKAYVIALSAFKADPPDLTKNKHVSYKTTKGQTDYDHATLDHVSGEIGKALSRHGLSHTWKTRQENDVIWVTCILMHVEGHTEEVSLPGSPDHSGGKNAIQAIGSTVSYLQRYTLLAATGLATRDMDDDGAKSESNFISDGQCEHIKKLANEVSADFAKFLEFMGVLTFPEIPAKDYRKAVTALDAKRGPPSPKAKKVEPDAK